ASFWTLAGQALPHTDREYSTFEFKTRVEQAAKAGFKGLGFWHADLQHVTRTRSLKEMRQILDDNGIRHVEIEFLADWFLDGERRKASDAPRLMLLQAAEVLAPLPPHVPDPSKPAAPLPPLLQPS